MTQPAIPFNRPVIIGNEYAYMAQAVGNGHISGDGEFTRKCNRLLEEEVGAAKALLTTSCTHALEMGALLLDIQPGDEVIVPSFTFVSTVNAFVLRGATPVFCDIRPDTLNLNESILPTLITDRTKAIAPVHYAGVGCEMDAIMEIADTRGIAVVEDNAHGLFGKYKGRQLGTFGCLATQSFHETKNFSCGEGGALLINDRRYADRAEVLREKGTNRSQFFRGEVDKYSWVDVGSSYLPSDALAAFLLAQLEARDRIQERRRLIWQRYFDALGGWASNLGIQLPTVPPYCDQSWHMFYMLTPTPAERDALIALFRQNKILSVFHYLPLHTSTMGRKYGGNIGDCPVTESVSERLLRLPMYYDIFGPEQEYVIETALRYPE
ncbi:MAG: dTDP-4-amino-4,6-dideoxygalactose transaminase [Capsulimonas sp.]|uniref:dTDP-4-amino-4,6-dideoxygalactose transaminase n=1 Tax=Capsulimonas sp. TaxID=2494211 RepID=UPI0032671E5D